MKPGKPRKHGHNVVSLPLRPKPAGQDMPAADALPDFAPEPGGLKSKADDKRVKEAMRLAQAFLAIEDASARRALIDLAERLVTYDWVRKVK